MILKRTIAIIFLAIFCACFVINVYGIHRKSGIYVTDGTGHVSQSGQNTYNTEQAVEEELAAGSDLRINSDQFRDALEAIGYTTTTERNGGQDYRESLSKDKSVKVTYDTGDAVSYISVEYKYSKDPAEISTDDPLTDMWAALSEIVNKKECREEFTDFVKKYKELDGRSVNIGSVSLYSQIYHGEFCIDIQEALDDVR